MARKRWERNLVGLNVIQNLKIRSVSKFIFTRSNYSTGEKKKEEHQIWLHYLCGRNYQENPCIVALGFCRLSYQIRLLSMPAGTLMSNQLIKAVLIKHDEEDDRLEQLDEDSTLWSFKRRMIFRWTPTFTLECECFAEAFPLKGLKSGVTTKHPCGIRQMNYGEKYNNCTRCWLIHRT